MCARHHLLAIRAFRRPLRIALGLFALSLASCSDCTLAVATRSLPDATLGVNYFFELNSNCGGDDWFLQTGTLPPGIGLQDDGRLKGVPTALGSFQFTVGVVDFDSGEVAFKGLSITVGAAE